MQSIVAWQKENDYALKYYSFSLTFAGRRQVYLTAGTRSVPNHIPSHFRS